LPVLALKSIGLRPEGLREGAAFLARDHFFLYAFGKLSGNHLFDRIKVRESIADRHARIDDRVGCRFIFGSYAALIEKLCEDDIARFGIRFAKIRFDFLRRHFKRGRKRGDEGRVGLGGKVSVENLGSLREARGRRLGEQVNANREVGDQCSFANTSIHETY
jgi:hypothetical protein